MQSKEQIYLEWRNKDFGIDTEPFTDQPHAHMRKRTSENSILFLVEYLVGLYSRGELTQKEKCWFANAELAIRTINANGNIVKGLYDRGGAESLWLDKSTIRTISHDNLRALFNFSYLIGSPVYKEIFNHGRKNFWRYDNVFPDKPRWSRFSHPREIIYFSRFGATLFSSPFYFLIGRLLFPVIPILQIFSCFKKFKYRPALEDCIVLWWRTKKWPKRREIVHTDGKIIGIVENLCTMHKSFTTRLSLNICHKILKWRLKTDKPFEYLVNVYFKHKEHPVKQSWKGIDERLLGRIK